MNTTPVAPTDSRRRSRRVLRTGLVLAALVLASATFAAPATPAGAWANNSNVTLQGSSVCKSSKTTWVWVEGSNGERGWATNGSGRYHFAFKRVPTSGMTVRVNFGNSTFSCTTSFGLNRPAVGTNATRNVVSIY